MKSIKLSAHDRALLYRTLVLAAAFFVLLLLETSFLCHFTFFGAVPDLLLILLLVAARETDEMFGGTAGLVGGVLCYMMGDTGLAVWILFYAAIGYLCGLLSGRILGNNYPSFLIFAATAAFGKLLCGFVLCLLLSTAPSPFAALWQSLLPEFVITMLAAALLYVPMRQFVRRTARKESL